jgi:CHAD domain-containing protein
MASSDKKEFPLLVYLDELVEDLHKNVNKALRAFDADAIHDARVATRRLKAAMGLLESVVSSEYRKPFEKVLKKLRRRLGPLRDLDVMIDHLQKTESIAAHAVAAAWMRERLSTQRDEQRLHAGKKGAPADVLAKLGSWWSVREEIVEAREAVDTLLSESLHLQLDAFAEQAGQLSTEPGSHREDPHQLRITGKSLRYTLELAKSQGHKLPAAILKGFKKMQEALGNWHDAVVLVERAMSTSLDHALSFHHPQTQDQLLKLTRLHLNQSERELANFSKLWQKHGRAVADTIRQRFPLTRAVTEPQKDPDPIDSHDMPAQEVPAPDVASNA